MSDRQAYRASAHRERGWWVVVVDDLERGKTTQVRRIDQIDQAVRELVVLELDLPESAMDDVDIEIDVELPEDLRCEIASARAAQADADKARRDAAARTVEVVARLRDELGLTVRDVGKVLGVSPQRAQQLASPKNARSEDPSTTAPTRRPVSA